MRHDPNDRMSVFCRIVGESMRGEARPPRPGFQWERDAEIVGRRLRRDNLRWDREHPPVKPGATFADPDPRPGPAGGGAA